MQVIPFFDKPCIVGAPAAELARPCKRQRGQYVNARVGRSTSGPVCGDCDSHSSALGVEIPVSEDFCVVLALLYCLVILGLLDLARLAADAIKAGADAIIVGSGIHGSEAPAAAAAAYAEASWNALLER